MEMDICYGGVPAKVPNNTMGIRGYDYIEYYVGSAKMVAFWHAKAMGLKITAYMGPETGVRDRCSYYLEGVQGLKMVITSALQPGTADVQAFLQKHGDGFKRWAVEVNNVTETFEKAVKNGGVPIVYPTKTEDDNGYIEEAAIRLYDDSEIVFINRDNYKGLFKPGFGKPMQGIEIEAKPTNLKFIDHIVGNVHINEMNYWANYINKALDFETFVHFGPGDISTQYSALLSKVVRSKDEIIKNPINEPFKAAKMSQIEEYTREYHGSGIQHVALATADIITTVKNLRANGVEFLQVPANYYDELEAKPDFGLEEDIKQLREHGILCDVEGEGYLLQLFTKPIGDRPTFFYEIIQRKNGASGFGQGNFQSLFEAIERDQELRGNL
jgi:4-hydroxyphenylpyruvate dioxygenase